MSKLQSISDFYDWNPCENMQFVSDIESFDGGKFRETLSRFLGSLAVDMEVGSPSLASLSELKYCFLEPNKRVLQLMLACKDDILANRDLVDFMTDYLYSCGLLLHICNALTHALIRAEDRQSMIKDAFYNFEQVGGKKEIYQNTLRALKKFKASGNVPFRVDFCELLERVSERDLSWFVKLKDRKSKLDNKLKNSKGWRTLSDAIMMVTFASVMVYSVLAMPRLVTAVAEAAAAAMPLADIDEWMSSVWKVYEKELKGQSEMKNSSCFWARIWKGELNNIGALVGKWQVEVESILLNDGLASRDEWISSVWHEYEKELKVQREVMSTSYFWTPIGKGDLDDIRALVDKLEVEMESVLLNDGFASRDETAVMLAMDDLKKKFSEFMKTVQDLRDHTVDCGEDVMEGRQKFMRMISE